MKLHLDVREKKLAKLLDALQKTEKVKYETKLINLPLGDAIILDDDDNELLIIERKSLLDLGSSIVDGRYKEQSLRLHHEPLSNHNIMYVIEGTMDEFLRKNYSSRINENTLYSAMFTLNYTKGFSVIRTFSILETATWIMRMLDKLDRTKEKTGFYHSSSNDINTNTTTNTSNSLISTNEETGPIKQDIINNTSRVVTQAPVYSSVVKRVKKENLRPDNIGEVILSQIPGISTATSLAVMNQFGSLYNLMIELKKDRNCLHAVTYETKNNQRRHISRTSIESIIKFLLYQKETTIEINTE